MDHSRLRIFLTGPMAAAWTGRPESTLRRWIHERRVTRYGTPRGVLYDLDELPERAEHRIPPRRDQPA